MYAVFAVEVDINSHSLFCFVAVFVVKRPGLMILVVILDKVLHLLSSQRPHMAL